MRVLYYSPGLLMCGQYVNMDSDVCGCCAVFSPLDVLFEKCLYVSCVFFGRRLLNIYLHNCLFLPFGFPCSLFLSFGFLSFSFFFFFGVSTFIHSFRFVHHIKTILFDELLRRSTYCTHLYIHHILHSHKRKVHKLQTMK